MAKINYTLNGDTFGGMLDGSVEDLTTLVAYILSDIARHTNNERSALTALVTTKTVLLACEEEK